MPALFKGIEQKTAFPETGGIMNDAKIMPVFNVFLWTPSPEVRPADFPARQSCV